MQLPETMRAVVLTGHGGLDKLEYHEDWPTPTPAAGEVFVRVAACGLSNTDINTRTAWYPESVTEDITTGGDKQDFDSADADSGSWGSASIRFPRIQGADVSGSIAAVDAGVDAARIGERVILDPWILASGDWLDASRSMYFGSECDGDYAEYTRIRSYRKSLPSRSRQLHLGSLQRDYKGQLDHRGGRYRYRSLRLFTSAISGFGVEPDYASIGDPVAVYA